MIKAIETVYNGYRFRSRLEARWAVFFDAAGIRYEYELEGYHCEDGTLYLPDFYLPDFRCLFEVKRGGIYEKGIPNDEWIKSKDWQKIISLTESLKIRNDDKPFDYIVFASGSPFDCLINGTADCGLLFNGIIGVIQYSDDNGKLSPKVTPLTEKDGLPMWGHLPIRLEGFITLNSDDEIFFWGKRSYEDIEKSNGKYEIVPIGQRCGSLFGLMRGIMPRYRGTPLCDPAEYFALDMQDDSRSIIYSACIKSRQARFEHGETPTK